MSLSYALLTALMEKSGTGSELSSRFEKSIGYFWSASHQQIYRELSGLHHAGLVDAEEHPNSQGRRRVFSITHSGKTALQEWLVQTEVPAPIRDAFLVRLRALSSLTQPDVEKMLTARLAVHRTKLAGFKAIRKRDFGSGALSRKDRVQALILDAGIRNELSYIQLIEDVLDTL